MENNYKYKIPSFKQGIVIAKNHPNLKYGQMVIIIEETQDLYRVKLKLNQLHSENLPISNSQDLFFVIVPKVFQYIIFFLKTNNIKIKNQVYKMEKPHCFHNEALKKV